MAFYKLTDEEIAKLPASDQFARHYMDTGDLQVEFPTTNVGTRLHLDRCEGVTLTNLGREDLVLTTLMGHHPRLGGNSEFRNLDKEVCKMIVEFTLSTD